MFTCHIIRFLPVSLLAKYFMKRRVDVQETSPAVGQFDRLELKAGVAVAESQWQIKSRFL